MIAVSVGNAVAMLEGDGEPHRFDVEDGDPAVIERACFFGAGEDGSFLFWDVAGATDEYDIWLLAPDLEDRAFRRREPRRLLRPRDPTSAAIVLGPGRDAASARFDGIAEATLARGAGLA